MEIYSHVSAAQQREAVEVLQRALAESHLGPDSGGQDWAKAAETGQLERESGSGGRVPVGYWCMEYTAGSRPPEPVTWR